MSERWKYQIKSGLLWGIIMTVINVLFELQEKTLQSQLTSADLYVRFAIFTFFGIFLLGYMNWRANIRKPNR